jgi:hypothetical protein
LSGCFRDKNKHRQNGGQDQSKQVTQTARHVSLMSKL